MKRLAIGSMKLFAALAVTFALAGIAQAALSNGTVGSKGASLPDGKVDLVSPDLLPDDSVPMCAKKGSKARVWPMGSTPYGHSYAEWTASWWRWALSMPPAINPILDVDGTSCSYGQHGPVWFLAGNFGGTTTRDCSIACNKAIFLPIINCEWENAWVGQPVLSIPDLRALCAYTGTPDSATLEVDGVSMLSNFRSYRVMSNLFDYAMGPDNLGGQPAGVYFPTISDGIWAMIDPLPPGAHTIHFTATGSGGGFVLDLTYHLDVVALELPCSSPPCP